MTNVVVLQGRLARDPELRQTGTGKQVARFTLAVDRGRKDANGQSQTDWINVIAWERLADFVYKYLSKGQMVNVDGRLQSSSYTARDGTSRTALEVVAAGINFCGSKADSTGQPSPAPAGQPAAAPAYSQPSPAPAGQPRVTGSAPAYSQPGEDFALIEDDGDLPF